MTGGARGLQVVLLDSLDDRLTALEQGGIDYVISRESLLPGGPMLGSFAQAALLCACIAVQPSLAQGQPVFLPFLFAAEFSVTPERMQLVDFVMPYYYE